MLLKTLEFMASGMAFSDGHTGCGTREEALQHLRPEIVLSTLAAGAAHWLLGQRTGWLLGHTGVCCAGRAPQWVGVGERRSLG